MFVRIKNSSLVSFFLLSIFLQSSVTGQTSSTEITPEPEKSETELIHFGDLIDVDIVGSVEFDWRGTINPEGFLQGLDYIEEPVYALCKTEEAVAEAVAKGYSKLLRNPIVKVRVLDRSSRPAAIIYGAVKNEQRFQIKRSVYLNELIISSGGITEKASGTIQIFRPAALNCSDKKIEKNDAAETIDSRKRFVQTSQTEGASYINVKISDLLKGEKDSNPEIFSGDIITVLAADPIYVIGGVAVPKQIASRSEMTLSRAIASAGGLAKDADSGTVTVFRRSGKETKVIEANYEKIDAGQAEDIVLQAFDVVEVAVKGRGKSKFAPIVKVNETEGKNADNLPLRIID